MKRTILLMAALLSPAGAQDIGDVFADAPDGAKLHAASGFVCPLQIGEFERDAVGQKDPGAAVDYCAYSALDGVYGTVTLTPLPKIYDPRAMLTADFAVQEGSGAAMSGETVAVLGPRQAPLSVYVRAYRTASLESLHYETEFASAAVGAWVVAVEIEYATPRDQELRAAFLNAVYAAALKRIAH